jgi:hypothetical protein
MSQNSILKAFRAACEERKRDHHGWDYVGHVLYRALEAQGRLDGLRACLEGDGFDTWEWVEANLPEVAALVPARNVSAVVEGLLLAHGDPVAA